MKFTPVLLAGLAAAAPSGYQTSSTLPNITLPDPSSYENVDISNLSIREVLVGRTLAVQSIESVSFTINANVTCEADAPGTEGKVFGCGSSGYSFGLINGTISQFALRLYHQTSPYAGTYGYGDIDTYCRSGGGSIEICDQINPTTIVITGQNGITKH